MVVEREDMREHVHANQIPKASIIGKEKKRKMNM